MINKRMEDIINKQINAEFYSANIYLSMAAYFQHENLPGFAHWMRLQFQEEQAHAMGFVDYLSDRGGRVRLAAIEAPQVEFKSALEVFEKTLAHERQVTSMINDMMVVAREENDYAAQQFLNWYINEQVEEEATAESIIAQLKLINCQGTGMLIMDRELGARTFTQPNIGG